MQGRTLCCFWSRSDCDERKVIQEKGDDGRRIDEERSKERRMRGEVLKSRVRRAALIRKKGSLEMKDDGS